MAIKKTKKGYYATSSTGRKLSKKPKTKKAAARDTSLLVFRLQQMQQRRFMILHQSVQASHPSRNCQASSLLQSRFLPSQSLHQ